MKFLDFEGLSKEEEREWNHPSAAATIDVFRGF